MLPKEKLSQNAPNKIAHTKGHLLIVDDEPMIRYLFAMFLESRSYTVELAEEAEVAWSLLQSMKYDCILLDLNIPQMGGKELYKLINTFDHFLGQRVIFISGDTASLDSHDFLNSTGNIVLAKPFHLSELNDRVGQVLNGMAQAGKCQKVSA